MSDKLEIRISGNATGASNAFKTVTQDAQKMGQTIEQTNAKSARSMEEVNRRATALGAGLGAVVSGISLAGRAFQDQENQIRTLNRAYGESSDQIQKFSRDLQKATTYSDDAARQSAITAATLTRNYGLTAAEVEKVIKASADLAAVSGLSLTDATQRVTAAIRGEAESAEALGLTMNQQAIDRQGLTLTMSNQEAAHFRLNALLEQSAFAEGAAGDAAETHAGQAKQLVNVLQDQIQAIGEATGVTGEYLSVLSQLALVAPIAGAAASKILTGLGGAGAVARFGGALALPVAAGLSIAGVYNEHATRNTPGGGWYENFLLQGMGLAGHIPYIGHVPYIGGVGAYSTEQLQRNDVESALAAAFYVPPTVKEGDTKEYLFNRITSQGYGYDPGVLGRPPNQTEISAWIADQAAALGMTTGQWIASTFGRADSGYVTDPTTGMFINRSEYPTYVQARTIAAGQPGQGNVYGTGAYGLASTAAIGGVSAEARAAAMRPHGAPMEFDPSAQMARAGGIPAGGGSGLLIDAAATADKTTAALKKTLGAYYDLVTGMNVAGGAAEAFKATQDTLIDRQGVYGQQISEFSQQQQALTAGRDVLLQRQADGVQLTKEEQELLDKYPELYERVSGGVDDATVSQGLLAEAYIENMSKGDQMNASIQTQTESTESLNRSIDLLILGMNGIPEEVRTAIYLDNIDLALANIQTFAAFLAGLPDKKSIEIQTIYSDYVPGSNTSPFMHGGVAGYANGGIPVRLAEAGPELLSFANGGSAWANTDGLYSVPRGTYVTPAPASRGRGSGGGITINGNVIVMANDARQMEQSIREWAIGSSRS